MAIRDLIEQIAAAWPAYHLKGQVDKNHPVYAMVSTQFPQELLPYVAAYDTIRVEGSTGAGNITAAPWIALFDRRLNGQFYATNGNA